MAIELKQIAIPKTTRATSSKYAFGSLTVGGPALVDNEVIDRAKAQSRMTSALVAYRSRTGDRSKFSVRTFQNENGTDAVGVWKTGEAPVAGAA